MTTPQKFRKKPVVIEAMEYDGVVKVGHPLARWVRDNGGDLAWSTREPQRPIIETLEGSMDVMPGDWVVRGTRGEFYPVKPEPFADTFERVES